MLVGLDFYRVDRFFRKKVSSNDFINIFYCKSDFKNNV